MKKLFLLAGCAIGWLAALPAAAQYNIIPNLSAHRNPNRLNLENEVRFDQGLPGWTALLTGTNATQTDPAWTAVQTLPFGFQMGGQTFTSYKVSSSGVLTFSTAAVTEPPLANTTLPSAAIPDNSVCLWGTLLTASNDFIISKTFGTAPNRQHWVQFNSVSLPVGNTTAVSSGFLYGSIVLEESTNKVYLVWQQSGATGQSLTAGIQLNATTAVQVPASPNVSIPNLADTTPNDNAYYEFSPGVQLTRDASLEFLRLPNSTTKASQVRIRGNFRNLGSQNINSLTVNYQVGGGAVVSAPVSGYNLRLLDSAAFVHPTLWQPTAGGVIPVKVWLSNPNGLADQNPANDTVRALVVVADSTMRRKVVEESFTSSTCPPCRPGNINVQAVNRVNAGKFVVIRYQQNFPAPGTDPYYTAESGARRGFYGINAIPYMMLDGGWNENSQSLSTSVLNSFQAKPAPERVGGGYTLTRGSRVTANATVLPLFAVPAGRLVAHMVITERRTVRNARTNGEVEFHDVMKKMLPNENGTVLPALASGQTFNLNQLFEVSTLPAAQAVEHFDSLRVVVFVQDVVTKEIYQGEYLALPQVLAARTAQSGTAFSLAPNPADGRTALLLTLNRPETAQVEVLDALGRIVYSRRDLRLEMGAAQIDLDLARQAAGFYTVRLTTSQGSRSSKLALN